MKPYMPLIGNKVYTDIGKTYGSETAVAQYNRDISQYEQTVALQKLANNRKTSTMITYEKPTNYYRFNSTNPNHHKYIIIANKIDRFDNTYTPFLLLTLISAIFALFICVCISANITPALSIIVIINILSLIYVRITVKQLQIKLYQFVAKSKQKSQKEVLNLQH